ncbi:hypothetical protein M6B38_318645 [Iris pallida]|uniref:Uncharacterized protein n=1 Tax=Iris pallida TaxID=29817 RepID=A0AAX6HDC5_IRIPA|nr:hypothetical protein M6B38_318645 [Iris pallida]
MMLMVVVMVKFKPPISSVFSTLFQWRGIIFSFNILQPFVKRENEDNWDQHNMNVDCSIVFFLGYNNLINPECLRYSGLCKLSSTFRNHKYFKTIWLSI